MRHFVSMVKRMQRCCIHYKSWNPILIINVESIKTLNIAQHRLNDSSGETTQFRREITPLWGWYQKLINLILLELFPLHPFIFTLFGWLYGIFSKCSCSRQLVVKRCDLRSCDHVSLVTWSADCCHSLSLLDMNKLHYISVILNIVISCVIFVLLFYLNAIYKLQQDRNVLSFFTITSKNCFEINSARSVC